MLLISCRNSSGRNIIICFEIINNRMNYKKWLLPTLAAGGIIGGTLYSTRDDDDDETHHESKVPQTTLEERVVPDYSHRRTTQEPTRENQESRSIPDIQSALTIGTTKYDLRSADDVTRLAKLIASRDLSEQGLALNDAEIATLLSSDDSYGSLTARLGMYLEDSSFHPLKTARVVRLLEGTKPLSAALKKDPTLKHAYEELQTQLDGFRPEQLVFGEGGYVDYGQEIAKSKTELATYSTIDDLATLYTGIAEGGIQQGKEVRGTLNQKELAAYTTKMNDVLDSLTSLPNTNPLKANRLAEISRIAIKESPFGGKKLLADREKLQRYAESAVISHLNNAAEVVELGKEDLPVSGLYRSEIKDALQGYLHLAENSRLRYVRVDQVKNMLEQLK